MQFDWNNINQLFIVHPSWIDCMYEKVEQYSEKEYIKKIINKFDGKRCRVCRFCLKSLCRYDELKIGDFWHICNRCFNHKYKINECEFKNKIDSDIPLTNIIAPCCGCFRHPGRRHTYNLNGGGINDCFCNEDCFYSFYFKLFGISFSQRRIEQAENELLFIENSMKRIYKHLQEKNNAKKKWEKSTNDISRNAHNNIECFAGCRQ